MKRFLLLFTLALLPVSTLLAARQATASGRVIDEKGAPVEFATVILLQAEKQVAGMTTDADGCFSLKVAAGDYTLRIQYVGYQTLSRDLQLEEGAELGDFVLCASATEIEDVVVQAQIVRREADRFVVDVANSPVAVGKDGAEMLKTAPGVWIDNDKISINGKSGSKVYVNERELKMESEQLLTYLRSLRAEDIQKIEVIPVSGADYDADSSAGIIKITLKRKRDDGMEGSVSYSTQQGDYTNSHSPLREHQLPPRPVRPLPHRLGLSGRRKGPLRRAHRIQPEYHAVAGPVPHAERLRQLGRQDRRGRGGGAPSLHRSRIRILD